MADINKTKEKYKTIGIVTKISLVNKIRVKEISNILSTESADSEMATFVTQKKITRHTFTEWAINTGPIEEMFISTYRIGLRDARCIRNYVDSGNILNLKIVLSRNFRMLLGKSADDMLSALNHKNIKLNLSYNHSKVTLMKQLDKFYVLTGSGNYSENDHIEEYMLINNKKLYDFHAGWMNGETEEV